MVNDELDYEIDRDDEDKEQSALPGEEVDSQEEPGKQAINKGFSNYCPVSVLYMVER